MGELTTNTLTTVLVLLALVLLLTVTGGIAYLTYAEWRDRRRQEQDRK
ncbi:hypothetical protein [Leptolyngbya sp. FACHB-261]|nr:hypothetical protein [Leptolyngbya sp. FACHB-261]MBD2102177.1 hypothetical protein [Leptolyngbya sp. FACHB-261]